MKTNLVVPADMGEVQIIFGRGVREQCNIKKTLKIILKI